MNHVINWGWLKFYLSELLEFPDKHPCLFHMPPSLPLGNSYIPLATKNVGSAQLKNDELHSKDDQ